MNTNTIFRSIAQRSYCVWINSKFFWLGLWNRGLCDILACSPFHAHVLKSSYFISLSLSCVVHNTSLTEFRLMIWPYRRKHARTKPLHCRRRHAQSHCTVGAHIHKATALHECSQISFVYNVCRAAILLGVPSANLSSRREWCEFNNISFSVFALSFNVGDDNVE